MITIKLNYENCSGFTYNFSSEADDAYYLRHKKFATENGYSFDTGKGAALSSYADAATVTAGANEAMAWACDAGLFNGYPDGTIKPQTPVNRAVAATLLSRFIELNK